MAGEPLQYLEGTVPFGPFGLDLWSALGAHRDLAGIADAAAVAGASGVDAETFRNEGRVVLDPALASGLALRLIDAQPNGGDLDASPQIVVAGDGQSVTVTLERRVELTLLQLVVPVGSILVRAEARSDASLRQ